ncbi:protein Flattop homolog [Zophobas morio]|uniref:protein Flattop homolog n=1 Tax=Zophobas morio TaxID=2755281 RepID=UPI003082B207
MSLHFSANQYEQAYKPRVLRNWEVPKVYDDKPKRRAGRTEIISNDRGHLLPGVPKSKASPWGNFKGAWHLPKKIDRKTADELSGLPKKISCEEKRRLKEEQEKSAKLEEIKEEPEQTKEEVAPPPDQAPPQVEKAPSEKAEAAPEIEEAPLCPIHDFPLSPVTT